MSQSIIPAIPVGLAQVCIHGLQVVGNHEFDWGSDSLAHYLQSLSYPALGACNLDFKGHWLAGQVTAWTTKAVKGRKVGCSSQRSGHSKGRVICEPHLGVTDTKRGPESRFTSAKCSK